MAIEYIKYPHKMIARSSAGSGKTRTLAIRYIQTLLSDLSEYDSKNKPENILAITFTNKAAQEMQERIITRIKELLLQIEKFEPLEELIVLENAEFKKIKIKFTKSIQKYLSDIFEDLLEHFYNFRVSTIDSFVNLITKCMARKLDVPPNFEITTNTDYYINLGINILLEKLYEELTSASFQNKIKKIVDDFLQFYVEITSHTFQLNWNIRNLLKEYLSFMWGTESNEGNIDVTQINRLDREKFVHLKNLIEGFISLLYSQYKLQDFNGGTKFNKKLEELYTHIKESDDPYNMFSLAGLCTSIFTKEEIDKKNRVILAKASPPSEEITQKWKELREYFFEFISDYPRERVLPFINFYNEFKKYIIQQEFVSNQRLIFIEDLNRRIHQKLFPYISADVDDRYYDVILEIYIYLAERYYHYLIDEFQDTNRIQWYNIENLIEETLSKGGSLFIVGDKKQSIFRFRGGDYTLVDRIEKRFTHPTLYFIDLLFNYRSAPEIVNFNNKIFDKCNITQFLEFIVQNTKPKISKHIDINQFSKIYEHSQQKVDPQKQDSQKGDGYIYIELISEKNENSDEGLVLLEDRIRAKVEDIMNDIKARNLIGNKSIAVLTRRTSEATQITEWLIEAGYKVESQTTLDIRYNSFINEIICFIKFLNNPLDNLSFANFITGNIFLNSTGITPNSIFQWLEDSALNPEPLYIQFRQSFQEIWDTYIEDIFNKTGFIPVSEIILEIYRKFKLLEKDEFKEYNSFFLCLFELAENISTGNDIFSFLEIWAESSENDERFKISTPSSDDTVKVLTIHKAKGLQFDIVILPYAECRDVSPPNKISSRIRIVRSPKDEENVRLYYINKEISDLSPEFCDIYLKDIIQNYLDEINNNYVAFTRAVSELYILIPLKNRNKNYLPQLLSDIKEYPAEIGKKLPKQALYKSDEEMKIEKIIIPEKPLWYEILKKSKLIKPEEVFINRLKAKKKGEIVHKIMESIKELKDITELENLIDLFLHKYRIEEKIKEELIGIFKEKEFMRFFQNLDSWKIFNEKEVCDSSGNIHRIDRLMIGNDRIIILEYKSGEDKNDEHIQQLNGYMRIIKEIFPEKEIEGFLVYIEQKEIIKFKIPE